MNNTSVFSNGVLVAIYVIYDILQLKEKYRTEVCSVEEELKKNKEIISQYKDICNRMSERNEKNTSSIKGELDMCEVGSCMCDTNHEYVENKIILY